MVSSAGEGGGVGKFFYLLIRQSEGRIGFYPLQQIVGFAEGLDLLRGGYRVLPDSLVQDLAVAAFFPHTIH